MELPELVARQIAADQRRGFRLHANSDAERLQLIERDLIGLLGEAGEFANRLKKVRLRQDHAKYEGPTLQSATMELREELADIAIYLIRLSVMLGGNLEADILEKMRLNDGRYAGLE